MQGVGVLMDIDIRSIVNTVLLEQTQQTDFSGEKTITTYYSGSFSHWSLWSSSDWRVESGIILKTMLSMVQGSFTSSSDRWSSLLIQSRFICQLGYDFGYEMDCWRIYQ